MRNFLPIILDSNNVTSLQAKITINKLSMFNPKQDGKQYGWIILVTRFTCFTRGACDFPTIGDSEVAYCFCGGGIA